jgi:hypothetical protein
MYSVCNQPGKIVVIICSPFGAGMITKGTLFRIIGKTVFLGNVPPIIVPLGEDDRDHLAGLQGHFIYVTVRKYLRGLTGGHVSYEDVDGGFLNSLI